MSSHSLTLGLSYFTSHYIDGIGTFQDGGLTFNNPAPIALKEAAAIFPDTPEPSIVVSCGTGSEGESIQDETRRRTWWESWYQNTCLARLAGAIRMHWDSSKCWKQLVSHQKAGGRGEFFRLDVEFQSRLPPLDSIDNSGEVARIASEAALGSAAMKQLAKCLRAELFLFELDPSSPPRFASGVYKCVGQIICRLRAGTVEFETFMYQLRETSASFRCQGRTRPGIFQGSDIMNADGNFCQKMTIYLPSRQHPLEISLQEESPPSTHHISGSPFTLDSLINQQKIHCSFGAEDHRKPITTADCNSQLSQNSQGCINGKSRWVVPC